MQNLTEAYAKPIRYFFNQLKMAERGGSSTTAGVEYESWYTALWFARAFLNENIIVEPQKKVHFPISEISKEKPLSSEFSQKDNIVSIDDLVVWDGNKQTYYNIKRKAPSSKGRWTFSELKKEKVLDDLKKQYLKTPNAKLVFVSEDKAEHLHQDEAFNASSSVNRAELESRLSGGKLYKWDELKDYFEWTDEELLGFSRQVEMLVKPESELKPDIIDKLTDRINQVESVPSLLCTLALGAAKNKRKIRQVDIYDYFRGNGIFPTSDLLPGLLKENMFLSSQELVSRKNTLGNTNIHLDRNETKKVYEWINESNDQSILLLIGRAGTGKTTVLRDVAEELRTEGIPVLGLKADALVFDETRLLEDELKLGDEIEKSIATVTDYFGKAVILIDQIDALSLSLSANRKPINIYKRLIDRFTHIPGVKIIISCRAFDLNYDELLKNYNHSPDVGKITVNELSDSELNSVLITLDIPIPVPAKLYSLLKTPSNLDVFVNVYDNTVKLDEIKSVQDLFDLLLQKRVEKQGLKFNHDIERIYELLGDISTKMHQAQGIAISRLKFEGKYSKELLFLETESILINASNSIQFFHQSFLDFIFARNLISNDLSLYSLIFNQHQGLFIRSMIRQIFTYLRETDPTVYSSEINKFLIKPESQKIRLHIKSLIIRHIADEEFPNYDEKKIVKSLWKTDRKLFSIFIESFMSSEWVNFFKENPFLVSCSQPELEFEASIRAFFRNSISKNPHATLKILKAIDINNKAKHVANALYFLEDWSFSDSISLFEEYKEGFESDKYGYEKCLKKAAKFHPDWFTNKIKESVKEKLSESIHEFFLDETGIHALESFFEFHPNKAFSLSSELILYFEKLYIPFHNNSYVPKITGYVQKLIDEKKFFRIPHFPPLLSTLESHPPAKFYNLAKDYIQNNDNTEVLSELITSNNSGFIQLAIHAFLNNPTSSTEQAFQLLTRNNILNDEKTDSQLSYWLRELIKAIYPHFSLKQKEELNNIILDIKTPQDELIYKSNGKNVHQLRYYGLERYKYLSVIPENERKKFTGIQNAFLEGFRKFNKVINNPPFNMKFRQIPPTIWKQNLASMNHVRLLETLKNLPEKDSQTAGELFNLIKENPNKYLKIVEEMLIVEKIPEIYKVESLNAIVSSEIPRELILPIFETQVSEFENYSRTSKRTMLGMFSKIYKEFQISRHLFDFLGKIILSKEYSERDKDAPTSVNGVLKNAINSISGSALQAFFGVNIPHSFEYDIFKLMEQIAHDESVEKKALLSHFIANLVKFNSKKTIKLFLKLIEDKNPYVLSSCGASLSYLMQQDFSQLEGFFNNAMEIDMMKWNTGRALILASWNDYQGADKILRKSLEKGDKVILGGLSFIFEDFIHAKENIRSFNLKFVTELLTHPSKDVQKAIADLFAVIEPKDYLEVRDFVKDFAQTLEGRNNLHHFYNFILKCASVDPKDCIEFLSYFSKHEGINPSNNWFKSEPLQALIAAYSELGVKNDETAEQAMDIMDEMIGNIDFRLTLNKDFDKISSEYHLA